MHGDAERRRIRTTFTVLATSDFVVPSSADSLSSLLIGVFAALVIAGDRGYTVAAVLDGFAALGYRE